MMAGSYTMRSGRKRMRGQSVPIAAESTEDVPRNSPDPEESLSRRLQHLIRPRNNYIPPAEDIATGTSTTDSEGQSLPDKTEQRNTPNGKAAAENYDRHRKPPPELDAVNDLSTRPQLVTPEPDESLPPSLSASNMPSTGPSQLPSLSESNTPSTGPSQLPSLSPSQVSTSQSQVPSSQAPNAKPSSSPSSTSSSSPTWVPDLTIPTYIPTAEPTIPGTISWEPTTEPTTSKTDFVAVKPPTAGPTVTNAPTITHMPTITMNPTISPAPTIAVKPPTAGPTVTYAPTITHMPTITMNLTISPAPTTLLDCLTVNGPYEYGRTNTGEEGIFDVPVEYRYEIELQEDIAPDIVQNEIVPKLELALNEQMLPALFDKCQTEESLALDGRNSADSTTRRTQTFGSPIVGISARPDDDVQENERCQSTEISSDACEPVLGELTIFLGVQSSSMSKEAEQAVLRLIKFAMDRDDLIDAHPDITKVVFIPTEDSTPDPTPQVGAETRNEGGTERMRGFPAIIVVAILFILLGLFMIYRGIRTEYEEYPKEQGPEEPIQTTVDDYAVPGGDVQDNDRDADLAALEYGNGDDDHEQDGLVAVTQDDVWPAPASGPSQGSRSSGGNSKSDSVNWIGQGDIPGNFSPADGVFELDVGGGWETPESSSKF